VKPGFCEEMEVTRAPPERPSRTTSGTRTTGWESLNYRDIRKKGNYQLSANSG